MRIKIRKRGSWLKGNASKLKESIVFLFVLTIIICFYPYEFQSCYFMVFPKEGPALQVIATLAVVIAYFLCLSWKRRPAGRKKRKIRRLVTKRVIKRWERSNRRERKDHLPGRIFPLLLVQLIGFSLCFIVHGQPQVIIIQIVITTLFISILALLNATIGIVTFFKLYNRWIFLMAALGAFTWALTSFAGFTPFYGVPDLIDNEREIYNYILTFSVHDSSLTAMRYSGFFDEPGAMANWGLFALLINKLFVKDKRIEFPLIICLLFTFSMGLYVQLILYFIFFYTQKNNKKKGLIVIAATVFVFLFLSTLKEGLGANEARSVYDMSIGRFTAMFQEGRENNSIAAVDSRKDISDLAKSEFLAHPIFGTNSTEYMGDNIYEPLAMYGLVGAAFVYFPIFWLLFSAYKRGDKAVLRMTIIIFVGFLHRPYHRNLLWNLIIYGIIIMYVLTRRRHRPRLYRIKNGT